MIGTRSTWNVEEKIKVKKVFENLNTVLEGRFVAYAVTLILFLNFHFNLNFL